MNARQRRSYWIKFERQRARLERKYALEIRQVLSNTVDGVIDDIREGGIDYAKRVMRTDILNEELVNILIRMYRETSILFGNMIYRDLKLKSQKAAGFGFNEKWARQAVEFLSTKGIPLISTIVGNLRESILSTIDKVIEEGFFGQWDLFRTIETVLERITDKKKDFYWAERIARTETVRGANYGAMQGAREHNFVVKKEWIAAMDERTRPSKRSKTPWSHRALDGDIVELEKPFNNNEDIMQPGDPDASPGNTINCRCTVAFEPVRDSEGKLIPK